MAKGSGGSGWRGGREAAPGTKQASGRGGNQRGVPARPAVAAARFCIFASLARGMHCCSDNVWDNRPAG